MKQVNFKDEIEMGQLYEYRGTDHGLPTTFRIDDLFVDSSSNKMTARIDGGFDIPFAAIVSRVEAGLLYSITE